MKEVIKMDKTKRRHQVLLHRCLSSKQVSQEVFLLITKLTDEEVSEWFASKLREIRLIAETLGMIVEYQAAKRGTCVSKMCSLRRALGQELSLWSDTVGFESSCKSLNRTELGLLVIKQQDPRQAAIWALRLDTVLPRDSLSVKSPWRIRNLVSRVSNRDM